MEKKIDIYKHQKKKLKIENPKKVSVIIPNYNYEKYIIERIDSVLMQTYPIYEIVILDDCSPDNSVKVINKKIEEIKKEHPEIKVQFIITEEKISNIKTIEEKNTSTPVIITIAREYGSGGRYIGKLVAEKLGIKLYDKNIIENMAEDTGLAEEYIEENEQKRNVLDVFNNGYYVGLNNADELFIKESEFIKKVASEESCIIVGRCADFIFH